MKIIGLFSEGDLKDLIGIKDKFDRKLILDAIEEYSSRMEHVKYLLLFGV